MVHLPTDPLLTFLLALYPGGLALQAPGWVVLSQQEAPVGDGRERAGGRSSQGVSLPISALGIISGSAPVSDPSGPQVG